MSATSLVPTATCTLPPGPAGGDESGAGGRGDQIIHWVWYQMRQDYRQKECVTQSNAAQRRCKGSSYPPADPSCPSSNKSGHMIL